MQEIILNNKSFNDSWTLIKYIHQHIGNEDVIKELLILAETGTLCEFLNRCYQYSHFRLGHDWVFNISFSNSIEVVVNDIVSLLDAIEESASKHRELYLKSSDSNPIWIWL
jgi:hypothetical protein